MFRISFVILAMASALALNGCSQCSNQAQETAPTEAPAEGTTEMAPVEGTEAPAATPAEGTEAAPAAPAESAPATTEEAPAH